MLHLFALTKELLLLYACIYVCYCCRRWLYTVLWITHTQPQGNYYGCVELILSKYPEQVDKVIDL